MTLADQLYNLSMALWTLQTKNYDVEYNYRDLLGINIAGADTPEAIQQVTERCNQILKKEAPPAKPEFECMFRESIAPVPNNSVVNVLVSAILAGGPGARHKPCGWEARGNKMVYEKKHSNAGCISISVEGDWAFVEGLSVFTADIAIALLATVCSVYCRHKTPNPMTQKAVITAEQLLRYKKTRSRGEKYWEQLERVNQEIAKVHCFKVSVKDALIKKDRVSYKDSSLLIMDCKQRVFNKTSKQYTPQVWQIRPGQWASYLMSKETLEFIGELHQSVLAMDHRTTRGTQNLAKKLMYALFTVPGGTHTIKKGANRSFYELLKLTGEYIDSENADKSRLGRSLARLAQALDYLVAINMVTTNISEGVAAFVAAKRKPWGLQQILDSSIQIKMSPA